jgi:antitoxin MazE
MQVAKWGNSLAIRLPAAIVEIMGLKEGDDIEVRVASDSALEVRPKPDNRAMLERLRQFRGTLPADFKFDRLEAYGDRG